MEKFIVVANFACYDSCDDDLYTSQWKVGIFGTVEDCFEGARKDLIDVACDHYECVLDEDEFDSEEEYNKKVEDLGFEYCKNYWVANIEEVKFNPTSIDAVEITSNDFFDDGYTDQRQIVKYYIYKV